MLIGTLAGSRGYRASPCFRSGVGREHLPWRRRRRAGGAVLPTPRAGGPRWLFRKDLLHLRQPAHWEAGGRLAPLPRWPPSGESREARSSAGCDQQPDRSARRCPDTAEVPAKSLACWPGGEASAPGLALRWNTTPKGWAHRPEVAAGPPPQAAKLRAAVAIGTGLRALPAVAVVRQDRPLPTDGPDLVSGGPASPPWFLRAPQRPQGAAALRHLGRGRTEDAFRLSRHPRRASSGPPRSPSAAASVAPPPPKTGAI